MQDFIGFDQNSLSYIQDYTITHELPSRTRERDALVSPFRPTMEGDFLEELAGGAFDRDGRLIAASAQPRSDGRQAVSTAQAMMRPDAIAHRLDRAVFGGFAFDHFGHFLLETTARLWCLPEYRDLPWLFLTDGRPHLSAYQRGFLELLGLAPGQIVAVSDWYRVDELVVPEPSFIYHHRVTHAYRDTFRGAQVQQSGRASRRIFLSRGNMTIARTIGEHELEEILAADGWDIVIPERLPAAEQAQIFHDDNIVMGLQGSAMHLGLFAPVGRRVVHLCRGTGYRGYYILDDLMQADATYLAAMSAHRLASKPIRGPFLLDLDRTIGFLRERDLLSRRFASAALPGCLDVHYQAWWHYTESQVRFHRQVADDGSTVSPVEALPPAMAALALLPDDAEILSHAVALTLKFEGVEAAGALLDHHPAASGDAHLLHFRSIVEDGRGNYEPALRAAEQALRLAPGNAAYINQVATILFRLKRGDEAEAMLRALIEAGGAAGVSYFLLSVLRLEAGDSEAGVALARQAMQRDGSDIGLCRHLAGTLERQGRMREALDAYRGFLARRSAPDADLLLEAARLEQALGNEAAGLEHRLAAWRLSPLDDAQAQAELREALIRAGQFPDLARAVPATTAAGRERAVLLYRRSLALARQGNMERALRVAVVAVAFDCGNSTIMQSLLGLMLRNKRARDAQLLIHSLAERGMATGETFYALSLAEGDLGRPGPAREAARQAAELDPYNDFITDHYGRLASAG